MADPGYSLTIDDTSPAISYSPFGDTFTQPNLTAGWNPFYTDSGFATIPAGSSSSASTSITQIGNGTSLHITAHDGAQIGVTWNGRISADQMARPIFDGHHLSPLRLPHGDPDDDCPLSMHSVRSFREAYGVTGLLEGTGAVLHGTVLPPTVSSTHPTNVTYTLALDGVPTTNFVSSISPSASVLTASSDVLASFSNLSDGTHMVVLTVHNPGDQSSGQQGMIAFDRAVVFADLDTSNQTGASSSTAPPPTSTSNPTLSSHALPDDAVSFNGQWSFDQDLIPGQNFTFHTSTNVGDKARVQFNASSLHEHRYEQLYSPALATGTAVALTGLTTPSSGIYNVTFDDEPPISFSARASFSDNTPTILFYRTGLDLNSPHTLEIVNSGSDPDPGGGTLLVVGSVNVTTVENTASADDCIASVLSGICLTLVRRVGGRNSHSCMLGSTHSATPVGASSAAHGIPRGTLAALVISGALVFIALCGIIGYAIVRRRRAAQKKQQFIVNPRVSRRTAGRLSFLSSRSVLATREPEMDDFEKGYESQAAATGAGVMDIRAPKTEEQQMAQVSEARHALAVPIRRGHASQNSDGSYSIELPDLAATQDAQTQSPPSPSRAQSSPSRSFFGRRPTSPRSPKPRGPREMHTRDSSRGILLSHIGDLPTGPEPEDGQDPATGRSTDHPTSPVSVISPTSALRVEFAEQQELPRRRSERYVSTGALSLPQSLRQALMRSIDALGSPTSPVAATSTEDSPPTHSFLDLSSSSGTSASRSAGSNPSRSESRRSSVKSQQRLATEQTARSAATGSLPGDRRRSMGLSMTFGGGPTSSRPSLTPNISLQPVPLPPEIPPLPSSHPQDSEHIYSDAIGMLPSPTDSIPLTVSDIHFRHSVQSTTSQIDDARRASGLRVSGSHRPPHPPLPGSVPGSPVTPSFAHTHERHESQVVRPFIVQKLLGMHTPGSGQNTPFSSPYGSPTTPRFNPAAASADPSAGPSTGPSAGPSSGPTAGPSSRPGTASSTPRLAHQRQGSLTFGFSLSRQR
ncbi:hypothetical protein CERSUDRAFT_73497 [Gelatoporia subvermispora B]|uniref:Uncharacterized protein n=1 Tax=Ceriporiopsis subvermispora (strain B) TaxID=914234 RepID=M2QZK0_CERS8|nr:hypothetical protein CERSUDRAFT_73497 [Gelatoporia subvermispora B]